MLKRSLIIKLYFLILNLKNTFQYLEIHIKREITKAYCGFSFDEGEAKKIVTGNWAVAHLEEMFSLRCLFNGLPAP